MSKIYGPTDRLILQTGGTLEVLEDGASEAVARFIVGKDHAFRLLPRKHVSVHPTLTFLVCEKVRLTMDPAAFATIEVTYNGIPPGLSDDQLKEMGMKRSGISLSERQSVDYPGFSAALTRIQLATLSAGGSTEGALLEGDFFTVVPFFSRFDPKYLAVNPTVSYTYAARNDPGSGKILNTDNAFLLQRDAERRGGYWRVTETIAKRGNVPFLPIVPHIYGKFDTGKEVQLFP